ncbi:MAG TPA: SDR family oxidoreductase [Pseudolabrys sp.]|jgi:NAD(P)-dependent dehydrogenase (short-subunit alcohol dehydrogenase family)|nr:SDR family oxidoreductase [Pseudolabrys sp.]
MATADAAVVTGASSGIGEAIAATLLDRGIPVVTLQRNAPKLKHKDLHFRSIDLTDLTAARKVANDVAAEFPVRYLVNNAGQNAPNPLEKATIEELNQVLTITLGAAMVLIQSFVPGMRRAKFGRIVNISSRAILGKSERVVYASAKAGLEGMTRVVAIETGADGITVNAVMPGPVETTHFNRGHPPGSLKRQTVIERILVGRLGTTQEIANAVMFLLDKESGFITGQSLFVCGGTSVTGTGGE